MCVGWRLVVVCVGLGALIVSTTSAQDASLDVEARALFEAGRAAFEAGRFEDAFVHFQSAYRRSQRPHLLYDVGVAADRAGRVQDALAAYEKFVESLPDAPERRTVDRRIEELRGASAPPPPANPFAVPEPTQPVVVEQPPVEPSQEPPPQPSPSQGPSVGPSPTPPPNVPPSPNVRPSPTERVVSPRSRVPGVLTVAGGGVATLGGVALLVSARVLANGVRDTEAATWAEVRDDANRVPRREAAGYVMMGVGLAALGAGVIQLLLPAERSARAERRGVRVHALLSPTSVGVEGRF